MNRYIAFSQDAMETERAIPTCSSIGINMNIREVDEQIAIKLPINGVRVSCDAKNDVLNIFVAMYDGKPIANAANAGEASITFCRENEPLPYIILVIPKCRETYKADAGSVYVSENKKPRFSCLFA